MLSKILICLLLLAGSGNTNNGVDKNALFAKYLQKEVNLQMMSGDEYFIIMNLQDCPSCLAENINLVNKLKEQDNIKVIVCMRKIDDYMKKEFTIKGVMYDTLKYFFDYNIAWDKPAVVIKTHNKKISGIESLKRSVLEKYKLLKKGKK